MTEVCEVIVTAPDADWLAAFTRYLVDHRLAACGHNVADVRSLYRWAGNIEDAREARVALHTRVGLVSEIVAEADRQHPYEVPCVIATPVIAGHPGYIRWILDSTREPADPR